MGGFVLLNLPARGPETEGQAETGLAKLRKTLRICGWEDGSCREVEPIAGRSCVVADSASMANGPLFHGFC